MRQPFSNRRLQAVLATLAALAVLALPASASAATAKQKQEARQGTLVQLPGEQGCLVDRSKPSSGCGLARALKGPGPFMGSGAIALSPDGKNVYVASSKSDAIATFRRDARGGTLTQLKGAAGCIAVKGASAGCISGLPVPVCAAGRALLGPDVIVISPSGSNVYVGSFFGNAVAVFDRDRASGALTQPGDAGGCIAEATSGCAVGIALGAPEGMAISGDGASLYVASALSNAVVTLARDRSTGTLTQATDGSGCIVNSPLTGCATGVQLSGANAVAFNPGGDVYVTSLFSNSVTSFTRSSTGGLTQKKGTFGCLVWLRAVGCSFGRALRAPEGLAVSPDGANVYAAAFANSAIAVLDR